jgi:hypothetical protein
MTKHLMWMRVAAAALALTACAGGDKSKTDSPAAKQASSGPGKDKITIALIAKSSANPVFLAARGSLLEDDAVVAFVTIWLAVRVNRRARIGLSGICCRKAVLPPGPGNDPGRCQTGPDRDGPGGTGSPFAVGRPGMVSRRDDRFINSPPVV